MRATLALASLLAVATACGPQQPPTPVPAATSGAIDTARLFTHVRALAHDSMRGRRTGTPDAERARRYVADQFAGAGLQRFGDSWFSPFTWRGARDTTARHGVNVVGWLRGSERPDRYLVVTAHYDHEGVGAPVNGDSIYNGADDDASGTAAVIELARWFAAHPPKTSVVFVAFDAEESALRGARAFVDAPPVPLDSIVLNVNMDMIGHNDRNELYAAGTWQYPQLKPLVARVAATAPVRLLMGHDTPSDAGASNWVNASDHAPFHARGVPFLYFGVEDHADYHKPSDEWSSMTPDFFARAVETVLAAVRLLDAEASAGTLPRR